MNSITRRISRERTQAADSTEKLLAQEWLVTNSLGGYASGTVAGIATRRYHGLLIASLPPPLGRHMLLPHLSERVRLNDGQMIKLSGEHRQAGDPHFYGLEALAEFRLEMGLPVWRYELPGATIERQIVMPHGQNTVYVIYRLLEGEPVRMKVMPSVHSRSHDAPVSAPLPGSFRLEELDSCYELKSSAELPTLRMQLEGEHQAFTVQRRTLPERIYSIEKGRGYEPAGTLFSPGYFRIDLSQQQPVALVASTEPWETISALNAHEALRLECERRQRRVSASLPAVQHGLGSELVLAADQFIVKPVGRAADAARIHAEGNEMCTVIAGYHWFTDWGRDTMISLEGLTLTTGRHTEAGYILRMFAHYIRDGLLPNLFPEGNDEGLYHTADATLWFFHALDRYVETTGDLTTLEALLEKLEDVARHHLQGTKFGIGVDPRDGLLKQGAEGYQLTWMDAKVDNWVVTPRRGKAVEINALWYNALRLLADWVCRLRGEEQASRWRSHAAQAQEAFNRRFWYADGGYLYDVVDGEQGDDSACRPNQVLAISLKHPILERQHWKPVLETVEKQLLTPVGLRSLAPGHESYCPQYFGDIYARDAAYHQGTVWSWLIGPYIDAWLKVHPDEFAAARALLTGFQQHMEEACIGSISEVFDAEPPYLPRGCIAQAWGVAEVLRCWAKTAQPE